MNADDKKTQLKESAFPRETADSRSAGGRETRGDAPASGLSQKMGVAALIMAGSVFLSRIMGLVRDKVVSWTFGAGAEADIYFTAFVVPDFINHLLAGGYISITLIPLLAARLAENEEDGWRFFSAVFWWVSGGIALLTLLAWLWAPALAPLAAPGFDAAQTSRLTYFLRIILPAQIFFVPGACLTAILYIRKQFFVPALTPLVYNGCIILGGLLAPGSGMEGFCWGVTGGAALGAFLLPLWAVRRGDFHLGATFRHPSLKKLVLLALPLMLGLSVTVMDEQLVRVFGSLAGEGAVSLLNYARRIMMVPVGVVAQAAGVASFPFLAALAAKGDEEGFGDTLQRAMRGSVCVVMPLCGIMIALSGPTLGFLFEGGRFTAAQTAGAAPLLQIMLLSVPFWTVQQVLGRAFYARQNTLTPALAGTAVTLAALPAYWWAAVHFGAGGVAVMTTTAMAAYTLLLTRLWTARFGLSAFAGLGSLTCRVTLLAALAACGAWFSAQWVSAHADLAWITGVTAGWTGLLRQTVTLAAGGLIFLGLYVPGAKLVCPEALRFRRRRSG